MCLAFQRLHYCLRASPSTLGMAPGSGDQHSLQNMGTSLDLMLRLDPLRCYLKLAMGHRHTTVPFHDRPRGGERRLLSLVSYDQERFVSYALPTTWKEILSDDISNHASETNPTTSRSSR